MTGGVVCACYMWADHYACMWKIDLCYCMYVLESLGFLCVCVYVWEHISCSSNLGAWDYVGMCIRFYNVFIHFTNNVITFNCIPIMFCIFKILRLLFKVSSYVFREIVCFFLFQLSSESMWKRSMFFFFYQKSVLMLFIIHLYQWVSPGQM